MAMLPAEGIGGGLLVVVWAEDRMKESGTASKVAKRERRNLMMFDIPPKTVRCRNRPAMTASCHAGSLLVSGLRVLSRRGEPLGKVSV